MNLALHDDQFVAAEHDVIASARALVPALRERQAETDALGRAPQTTAEELEDAGVFKLTIPHAYGGLETDTTTYMNVVSELGRGDAGIAWAVSLVNACNWMASGLYPRHVTDEVFADPSARVAGVFSNRGCKARRVEGGIHVEKGIWFFNSGVYHASWDLLGVPMFDKSGEPIGPGVALVPMSDVTILNDWDTIGICGSGSSNVTMEDVFIPDERIVPLMAATNGELQGAFTDQRLYRTAFAPLMVSILSFPILGAGMHMIEEFVETLPKRDIKLTPYTKQADAVVTQVQVAQASTKIDAAKVIMARACAEMDAYAARSDYMPRMERARICRDTSFSDQLVWEAVDMLGSISGGSFSRRKNVLNRLWADVKVGSMHPFVAANSNYELYGRMMCGIEPPLMPV